MKYIKSTAVLLLTMALASCLKKEYAAPPDSTQYNPQLPVSMSIRQLSNMALDLGDGKYRELGDSTICGVVIGDDKSGNIYKQLIIQDTSGAGIAVVIDKTTLYGDYPAGRQVYIRLKGLKVMNYKGLPELIYSYDSAQKQSNGIPSTLLPNYLVKGSYPNKVTPKVVTMPDLFSNPYMYVNTLVKLENVQFDQSSVGLPYSDAAKSTTRYLSDCPYSGRLSMYNSAFSNFQSAPIPAGKGSVVCIMSIYNTPQIILRDTSDIKLTATRECP